MIKKRGRTGAQRHSHVRCASTAPKTMSPTPIGRSRGHQRIGVGDSDLEAQKAHLQEMCVFGGKRHYRIRNFLPFLMAIPR